MHHLQCCSYFGENKHIAQSVQLLLVLQLYAGRYHSYCMYVWLCMYGYNTFCQYSAYRSLKQPGIMERCCSENITHCYKKSEYIQCSCYVKVLEKENLSNLSVANLTHKMILMDTYESTNCVRVCRPCIKRDSNPQPEYQRRICSVIAKVC